MTKVEAVELIREAFPDAEADSWKAYDFQWIPRGEKLEIWWTQFTVVASDGAQVHGQVKIPLELLGTGPEKDAEVNLLIQRARRDTDSLLKHQWGRTHDQS